MKKSLILKGIGIIAITSVITVSAPLGVSAKNLTEDCTFNEVLDNWNKVQNRKWYYYNNSGCIVFGFAGNVNWNKPEADKPQPEIPDSNKPEVDKPEADKPQPEIPDSNKPEVDKPEVDKPQPEVPDSNKPEVDNNQNSNISKLPELPSKYSVVTQASAEEEILKLMNQKRVEAGLTPLIMDNTLRDVARYKSNHMIQYNYFSHTNPDGTKWTNWLKTLNYKYTTTGENIAYNSSNAVELFNQWWNSQGHRENMMNPAYTKVGIGVIHGNGKYMGTQTFSN